MKTKLSLALAAVLLAVSLQTTAAAQQPRAADCTTCARSCSGHCVAQAGGCACAEGKAPVRSKVDDCYDACIAKAGADLSALEVCRAQCRAKK